VGGIFIRPPPPQMTDLCEKACGLTRGSTVVLSSILHIHTLLTLLEVDDTGGRMCELHICQLQI
jgi:hypothetical protein